MAKARRMLIVLGDQLNSDSAIFDDFDSKQDVIWMAEVASESEHVWSHQSRIALFLAAMRHFREQLHRKGLTVDYTRLDDAGNRGTLGAQLQEAISHWQPTEVRVVEPGEWRVGKELRQAASESGVAWRLLEDRHFLTTNKELAEFAAGRKQIRLEHFYRGLRRQLSILMDGDQPAGGQWNYDKQNRGDFGKSGPQGIRAPKSFAPDEKTAEVLDLVRRKFAGHPGGLQNFDWPVTPTQANAALKDFIVYRLPSFGRYQDAMWVGEPFLHHSRLSTAMNLKLLDPRDVIEAAAKAYRDGLAPIESVEGFVRQVLGWREYVRGIYWWKMPEYANSNALDASARLPNFYWTAETDMACLRETISQTLEYGYAHHIQRLMVTGLFALLLGVKPRAIHEWYLAIYVDAVEWVELPNVIGMSQFADGGLMASKPYVASGKYIQRMSNYCDGCRYNPAKASGEEACPFTTLYWDFLMRHEKLLGANSRMQLQLRNLVRIEPTEKRGIRQRARQVERMVAG